MLEYLYMEASQNGHECWQKFVCGGTSKINCDTRFGDNVYVHRVKVTNKGKVNIGFYAIWRVIV